MTGDATHGGPPRLEFGRAWDYGSAPESIDRAAITRRWELFIGGRWKAPRSGRYVSARSPASAEAIAEVAEANAADLNDAVRAARRAYDPIGSRMRGAERTNVLLRLARAVEEKARELSAIEAWNAGRPIAHARDLDLPLAVSYLVYYAGWADKLEYACRGHRSVEACGVVAQVASSACPLLSAVSSLAPALACGNTVLLTPHPATPLSALLLAQIVEQADLPPGVVNVLTGEDVGETVAKHTGVDAVVRAGDHEVAPVAIVFADAALDQAADALVRGLSVHQGPGGCRAPVLVVEESVHDPLVVKLRDRMATLRVGDPLDPNTDVGPILSNAGLDAIRARVTSAENAAAALYTPACGLPDRGYWLSPTLLTKVSPLAPAVREPTAGPVLSVLAFRTPDEAIETANCIAGALCASVWTEKGAKGLYVAQRLQAGVIWRNTYGKIDAASPFGRMGGAQGLAPYARGP